MPKFDLFYTGCLSVLKQHKHVSELETDNLCDAVLVATSEWKDHLESKFASADEAIEKQFNNTPVAALVDFSEWIEKWPGMPKTIELSTVSMNVTVPLASGSTIQFSASAILLPGAQVGQAYVELYDEIVKGYELFRSARRVEPARSGNGTVSAANSAPQRSGTAQSKQDKSVVPVEIIRVESKNGKRIVKLGGDIWSKFGVTCWPEVFDAAGWNPDDFELGETPAPKGWMMRLEMNAEDKPRKVKELFRA